MLGVLQMMEASLGSRLRRLKLAGRIVTLAQPSEFRQRPLREPELNPELATRLCDLKVGPSAVPRRSSVEDAEERLEALEETAEGEVEEEAEK